MHKLVCNSNRQLISSVKSLEEGSQLFIIFGDATSGASTYISGRFLYASKPGPPPQNILAVAVNAGEKNYGERK